MFKPVARELKGEQVGTALEALHIKRKFGTLFSKTFGGPRENDRYRQASENLIRATYAGDGTEFFRCDESYTVELGRKDWRSAIRALGYCANQAYVGEGPATVNVELPADYVPPDERSVEVREAAAELHDQMTHWPFMMPELGYNAAAEDVVGVVEDGRLAGG